MTTTSFTRFAGWCAYAAAAATVLGLITLIGFFIFGGALGLINDLLSIVSALTGIALIVQLHAMHRRASPALSSAGLVLGVLGGLLSAFVQTLLVLGVIVYEQTAILSPAGFSIFGAGLALFSALSLSQGVLPRRLGVWGLIGGAGYVLLIVGIALGGLEHPVTGIGGFLAAIFYTMWTIGFGGHLLRGHG
ncbi:MAG TPA: hypothetical protein VIU38_12880 [Anaerolineales bacterium]